MFDVNDDGLYDISIKLNSINGTKANVTLSLVKEEIVVAEEGEGGGVLTEDGEDGGTEEEPRNLLWLWITLGILIILILVAMGFIIWKKRRLFK
jgi:hypothetical protein